MEGFSLGACAALIVDGKLLLQQGDGDDYWALPGGHAQSAELSHEALARELGEELGGGFRVEELLWVVQTIFRWNDRQCHQIGFYYRVAGQGLSAQRVFPGRELHLLFRWFALAARLSISARFPSAGRCSRPIAGIKHLPWREEDSLETGAAHDLKAGASPA
jgi:ADP-ribose pyrophosphatase YjhB (NUDIX family)